MQLKEFVKDCGSCENAEGLVGDQGSQYGVGRCVVYSQLEARGLVSDSVRLTL